VPFLAAGSIVAPSERRSGAGPVRGPDSFAVDQRHALPPYHLVAEPSGGGRVVSRPIDVATVSRITWSLATNFVRVDG